MNFLDFAEKVLHDTNRAIKLVVVYILGVVCLVGYSYTGIDQLLELAGLCIFGLIGFIVGVYVTLSAKDKEE